MAAEPHSAKAVVLLSGGMDSCVCAAIARERHGAGNIALLHAGYGQRTQERERRAFEGIANYYEVSAGQRLVVKLDHFRIGRGGAAWRCNSSDVCAVS
jgi:7-cyano-7-deazaguanine synthase